MGNENGGERRDGAGSVKRESETRLAPGKERLGVASGIVHRRQRGRRSADFDQKVALATT
jgi:hypothetical protein